MLIFAGFLSLDVVCYIWDQYILSMKLPSFCCIAMFSAAMLMLLKKEILTCRNVRLKFVCSNQRVWILTRGDSHVTGAGILGGSFKGVNYRFSGAHYPGILVSLMVFRIDRQ